MTTFICPTCGCSLVRLGLNRDKSVTHPYDGKNYHFCCQGCVDIFITDPPKYLQETKDLIVCPTYLDEKPMNWAVKIAISEQEVYFCRCPYCVAVFKKKPDFYIKRLESSIPNEGVLDHEGCCIRPD